MKRCRGCGGPGTFSHTNHRGDVYRYDCLPYCTYARVIALAAGPRPSSFEPVPVQPEERSAS